MFADKQLKRSVGLDPGRGTEPGGQGGHTHTAECGDGNKGGPGGWKTGHKVVGTEDIRERISGVGKVPWCGNKSQWQLQCVGDSYTGLGGDQRPAVLHPPPPAASHLS